MGIWFDGMTLSDLWTKKPAYLFLTRLWRLPVIDTWSWGSYLSQFLGIFASLSVFGFCLPNPSEWVGNAASPLLCVGRKLRDALLSARAHCSRASLLSGCGFQLETWRFLFQEKCKILLWAFVSCYTWVPLIHPSLCFTSVIYHRSKKEATSLRSSRWGPTEATVKPELGIWGVNTKFLTQGSDCLTL